VAAKAQEKNAELSSLRRQQGADEAEAAVKGRELQQLEEGAVRESVCVGVCVMCVYVYTCICMYGWMDSML
jgi:hypothetical protein